MISILLVTIIVGLLLNLWRAAFSLIASIGLKTGRPISYTRIAYGPQRPEALGSGRGADRPGDPHGRRRDH